MRQTFFSLAQSPRPSVPYYWRYLLIGGRYRYLHRRAVLCAFLKRKTSGDVPAIRKMVVQRFIRFNHTPYLEGVTANLHRHQNLSIFRFTFVIYKFRNVSVRKCRIVQLAKFFMLFIIISTNSLNEMKFSLRPIISTATRQ